MDHIILQAVTAYLHEYTDRPKAREALLDFVTARPDIQPVASLMPVDQYMTRLDYIEELVKQQREYKHGFQINRLQFCYLIRMPTLELQSLVQRARDFPLYVYETQVHLLESMIDLTDYFLNPKGLLGPASGGSTQSETTQGRNKNEKDSCLKLDRHVCVVTGKPHPHVCHIIPFTWSKSTTNQAIIKYLKTLMVHILGLSNDIGTWMAIDSLVTYPGSSDRTWNMICLTPTLHDWWGRGYFAFKYLGATPNTDGTSTATLQFVWMPRYIQHSRDKAREPINLDHQRANHTRLLAALTHCYGERSRSCPPDCSGCTHMKRVNAQNTLTYRPIWTGSIFRVTRPTDDILQFQRMIEIQWAIICAASLSGRAQDIELLRDRDDDDERQGLGNQEILEWMGHVEQEKKQEHEKAP